MPEPIPKLPEIPSSKPENGVLHSGNPQTLSEANPPSPVSTKPPSVAYWDDPTAAWGNAIAFEPPTAAVEETAAVKSHPTPVTPPIAPEDPPVDYGSRPVEDAFGGFSSFDNGFEAFDPDEPQDSDFGEFGGFSGDAPVSVEADLEAEIVPEDTREIIHVRATSF